MPVFYLLTKGSQRIQHSQWGWTESWDVLGRCWLGHGWFFLCCNWVFPPVFQEGNNLPYLSCSPNL